MRRVQHRMQQIYIKSYSDYISYIQAHPEEFVPLFNTIEINFTSFFRDASAWEYIATEILPLIIANKSLNEGIRVWSAGCASGEEVYTLAIILAETLGLDVMRSRVKIFATDVDSDALNKARLATYTASEVVGIPPTLLKRYFQRVDNSYVFRQDLRHVFVFANRNLVQDAPMSLIDLLVCRNVLIYLNVEAQIKVLVRFHFGLKQSGFLFLGQAENADVYTKIFTSVNLKHHVFSKVPGAQREPYLLPQAFLTQ